MNKNHFHLSIMAAAVCAAISPYSAYAESQHPKKTSWMEEVVVTASRTNERAFNSQSSLSIITREDMDRMPVISLAELTRDIPGVQVTDSGQPGLGRIRIRGEESRRTAILINSQELTDHHEVGTPLALHPDMVERVEIVRGSGSVLYGSRALSGVANFITRKGGTEPVQATVSGSYHGATEGHDTFASVFGNLEGFEYRVAWANGDHDDRDTPEGEMENTSFDNESIYLYAGRSFSDHRLEYTFEDFESSAHVFVEEAVKTSFPLTDFYLETPQRDRNKHGLSYDLDTDNEWLKSFQANVFYQESDRHLYTRPNTIWYNREINNFSKLETTGALAQLNLQPLNGHQIIAGVQYLNDKVDQTRHVDTLAFTPDRPSGIEIIQDEASIETWAWFIQDKWSINDDLTMTVGLRQYFVEGELEDSNRTTLTPGQLDEDDEVIGTIGLAWTPTSDMQLRANISEGYVYPSLLQLATGAYAGSSFVHPDPDLSPEESVNYEVGIRLQRDGLVLDAAAFYSDADDYIHHLSCTPEDNCPGARDEKYLNIGESRAHGIELYMAYQIPGTAFRPYTSLTWLKRRNEFEEFSTWDSGTPDFSGRAGLNWHGKFTGTRMVWTDVYLRGETDSSVEEPDTVRSVLDDKSGWVTVNASAGIEFGEDIKYRAVLNLVNLTDKSYIASTENLYGAERSAVIKLTVDL
jgi:hemoglobin/transferrin/lactoferrin receptor protein